MRRYEPGEMNGTAPEALGMIMPVASFKFSSPGTMTISGKKYENADVVASGERGGKCLFVSRSERHPTGAESRAQHKHRADF
jgi:hypothetical protein